MVDSSLEDVLEVGVLTLVGATFSLLDPPYNFGKILNFYSKSPGRRKIQEIDTRREGGKKIYEVEAEASQAIKSRGWVGGAAVEYLGSSISECLTEDTCLPVDEETVPEGIDLDRVWDVWEEELDSMELRDDIVERVNDDVLMKENSLLLIEFAFNNVRFEDEARTSEGHVVRADIRWDIYAEFTVDTQDPLDEYIRGVASQLGKYERVTEVEVSEERELPAPAELREIAEIFKQD